MGPIFNSIVFGASAASLMILDEFDGEVRKELEFVSIDIRGTIYTSAELLLCPKRLAQQYAKAYEYLGMLSQVVVGWDEKVGRVCVLVNMMSDKDRPRGLWFLDFAVLQLQGERARCFRQEKFELL